MALKKLRYGAELLDEVGRPELAGDVAMLTQEQDILGRLHDLEVLRTWVREAQISLAPPNLTVWEDLRLLNSALERDCRQRHALFVQTRSKLMAIANRMGAGDRVAPYDTRVVS
jgi:CHAD domain-containing protein